MSNHITLSHLKFSTLLGAALILLAASYTPTSHAENSINITNNTTAPVALAYYHGGWWYRPGGWVHRDRYWRNGGYYYDNSYGRKCYRTWSGNVRCYLPRYF